MATTLVSSHGTGLHCSTLRQSEIHQLWQTQPTQQQINCLSSPSTCSKKLQKRSYISSTLTVPSPPGTVTLPTGRRSSGSSGSSILKERETLQRVPPLVVDPVRKQKQEEADEAFWDYQFLYRSQRNEVESVPLTVVEGAVPADLSGVYFLCGPGILSDDYGSQVHPLDGHGYLRKFVIDGANPVMYSAKYIDTEARREEFDEENKTWKFTYRGPFSLLRGGDRLGNVKVMKNVANTSVLQWAGRLMCLYEGGEPYELDFNSLQTLGLFNMEAIKNDIGSSAKKGWRRMLDNASKLSAINGLARSAAVGLIGKLIQPILKGVFEMPEERMLSHVKFDVKRKRLVVVTCRREDMVLPKSTFTIYEMDLSMQVLQRKVFTLNEQTMIHDWGLTDNHYVLLANRVKLNSPGDVAGSLSGMQPMINCLTLDDSLSYTPLYLLPRTVEGSLDAQTSNKRDWNIPLKVPGRLWFVHTANSFEETDDDGNLRITMDATACSYNWFSLMHMFGYEWQQRWLDPAFMNKAAKAGDDHGELQSSSNKKAENPVQLVRVTAFLSDTGEVIATDCQEFANNTYACDFPATHPATLGSRNEHTYLVGASGRRKAFPYFPFDTLLKLSGWDAPDAQVKSWWAGNRNFVGEPIFVPRPGSAPAGSPGFVEDDGYLIAIQYAAAEEVCYLVILDASLIGCTESPPLVARLRLPAKYAFPYGFHGVWTDLQNAHPSSSPSAIHAGHPIEDDQLSHPLTHRI